VFLSKIWFVLVGLVAGVATTAAFVAPRSADRRIAELEGQRLDRAQYAAEQMLKADAHNWIDYTAKLGRDAILAESLDSASRGAGEPRLLTETVRGRLKTLAPDLAGMGLESIGAVDIRGRGVGRIGDREGDSGDNLGGLEVISDALRGYMSDDVWGFQGKLRRVAAVPVLSKTRDRIVGAVYVAAESNKRLAEVWKKNLGVEIAILLRGQVLTATVPESFLANLPSLIEARGEEMAQAKRTRPIPLDVGNERLLAVAAPFAGMAGAQEGQYVLIGKMSPASDPLALLSTTTADDLRFGNFPWLGLGIGLLVILGVGVFLQRLEMERPLGRLRSEVQRLARGEVQKLQDHDYPGKFGGIARDVNAAMERFTLASPPKSETAKKDLDAILGPAPTEPASVFDLPQSHFGNLPAAPSFGGQFGSNPPQRPGPNSGGPPFITPPVSPAVPGPPPSSPGFAPPSGPSNPFASPPPPSAFARPPAPAPSFGQMGAGLGLGGQQPSMGATPERRLVSPSLASTRPPAAARLSTTPAPVPATLAHSPGPATLDGSSDALETDDLGPKSDGAGDAITSPGGEVGEVGAAWESHIKAVFDDYVATRAKCGEPTAGMSVEKFRTKLEANRQQLVAKYGCRTARFSVYVKDGKAAIKATPVR
jgi:hypothetical protein